MVDGAQRHALLNYITDKLYINNMVVDDNRAKKQSPASTSVVSEHAYTMHCALLPSTGLLHQVVLVSARDNCQTCQHTISFAIDGSLGCIGGKQHV